jgi:hypothetical protein
VRITVGPAIETDIALPLRAAKRRTVLGVVGTSIAFSFSTAGSVDELAGQWAEEVRGLPLPDRQWIETAARWALATIVGWAAGEALDRIDTSVIAAIAFLLLAILLAAREGHE